MTSFLPPDWPTLVLQGVGGALVAALAAFLTVLWQSTRERAAEKRRARSAARILRGDYLMWQYALAEGLRTGKWWSALAVTPEFSTPDDLRSLAERKDSFQEWAWVGAADRRFRRLDAARQSRRRPDIQEMAYVLLALDRARKQLAIVDDAQFDEHPAIPLARSLYRGSRI